MSYLILIDGYNLIYQLKGSPFFRDHFAAVDIEASEVLLRILLPYKREKKCRIVVVFDANEQFAVKKGKTFGIETVFTRSGQTADSYIISRVKDERGPIVISSDNEIRNAVERDRATAIRSEEFVVLLERATLTEVKGGSEDEDTVRTKPKKGPSRRLKKTERKKIKILKKLY